MPTKYAIRAIALSCLLALAGCGGGHHAAPATPAATPSTPPDTTPDTFSFTAQTNVPTGTAVDSNAITVSGIDAAATISVSGGTYSIGGLGFTSTAGTVSNGQSVQVRIMTPSDFDTMARATLTIGGVSATFSVTTYPRDATPDAFSFADATDAVRGTTVKSNTIAVAGINTPVAISVINGEYAIGGGSFTNADGTAESGQSVQLQVDASTTPGGSVKATLTIGGVSADFNVTTSSDVTPPTVSVLFPPPQSRTSGPSIVLRGTASDDGGKIAKLQVNGVDAATSDGYAHWTASLPLAAGDNALIVDAEDAYLNDDPNAAEVNVRRHARFVEPDSVALDSANNRALVMDSESSSLDAVDLNTGSRTVLSNNTPDGSYPFYAARSVVLDKAHNRALVSGYNRIVAVDLASGKPTILSDAETPDGQNPLGSPTDMVLDAARNRLLVLTNPPSIIAVDLTTGARTVLSDATTPDAANPFPFPWAIALDATHNRALVANSSPSAILAVDLTTGERSILSDATHPGSANPLGFAPAIAVDAAGNRALVAQPGAHAVYAVDLETGIRTVLSATGIPDTVNPFSDPYALAVDDASGRALVIDQASRALMSMDLATGARTYVSRDEPADAANPLEAPSGIAYDTANDRLLVTDYRAQALLSIDLATAARTVVSDSTTPSSARLFSAPRAIRLDSSGTGAYVLDDGNPAIFKVDLTTGNRTILTDATTPDTTLPLSAPFDLALDSAHNRLLVTDDNAPSVIAVDLTTGARSIFSSNSVPNADNPFANPQGIVVDAAGDRALVVDSQPVPPVTSAVLAIDRSTGARSILSNGSTPDNTNHFVEPDVLSLDSGNQRVFVADSVLQELLAVRLKTGARTVVTGDPGIGSGFNPLSHWPTGLAYDATRDVVYVVDRNAAAVLAVDVPTGQRVYVLR